MIDLNFLFPTVVGSAENEDPTDYSSLLELPTEKTMYGFERSKDTYILDNHAPLLRTWIQEQVDDYAKRVLCIKQELRITQSWLIIHRSGNPQNIFIHKHPNSIISGAYYLAADGAEGLRFDRNDTTTSPYIEWEYDRETLPNSPWAWIWHRVEAKKNRLLLFPSQLTHGVNGPPSENIRCSLSFNTWFKDSRWGSDELLGEVKY